LFCRKNPLSADFQKIRLYKNWDSRTIKSVKINFCDRTKSFNKTLKDKITIRNKRYLNNIIKQNHRFIKKLTHPTKGFTSFYSAAATLKGIELCHMINKSQLKYHFTKPIFKQFYALAA
jgi:transposase-like protein